MDASGHTQVSVNAGRVGYDKRILCDISMVITSRERIAIIGDNGSGKSTLIKALLGDSAVTKSGSWYLPKLAEIGYLDQHYATLIDYKTVFETLQDQVPQWPEVIIRRHLNDFLFLKNEEIFALVSSLSGGERARLSLAQLAVKTPKILILDEITNNLDLETREHVIQVLKEYPGILIVVSHDENFLREIGINWIYQIKSDKLCLLAFE